MSVPHISDREPVFESGECCEVCGGITELGECTLRGGLKITVCRGCHDGPALQQWVAGQMEAAFESQPGRWEKLPDGRWKAREVIGGNQTNR